MAYFGPWDQRAMSAITIDCIAGHFCVVPQFVNINLFRSEGKSGRTLYNHIYDGRRSLRSQLIVWCTGISSGMRIIHFIEKQTSISFVEDALRGFQWEKKAQINFILTITSHSDDHQTNISPERYTDQRENHPFPIADLSMVDSSGNDNLVQLICHRANEFLVERI